MAYAAAAGVVVVDSGLVGMSSRFMRQPAMPIIPAAVVAHRAVVADAVAIADAVTADAAITTANLL